MQNSLSSLGSLGSPETWDPGSRICYLISGIWDPGSGIWNLGCGIWDLGSGDLGIWGSGGAKGSTKRRGGSKRVEEERGDIVCKVNGTPDGRMRINCL